MLLYEIMHTGATFIYNTEYITFLQIKGNSTPVAYGYFAQAVLGKLRQLTS